MRPNFLVIGAQKSATSNLCDLLARHDDVFLTDPKEPYFFSNPEVWDRGMEWYESLFDGAAGACAIGEGSTTYTQQHLYPDAPARIIEHLPNARLIFLARDPLPRMQSHWMHLRSRENQETLPFNEAVLSRPEYVDHSRYALQLAPYRKHYSDDRLLVLFFEDFRADPVAVARQALTFLGVDPDITHKERAESRHDSARGRVDSPMLSAVRRIPLFRAVRDAAPSGLRNVLRGVLKKPIGEKPVWDPAVRQQVLAFLGDESRAFLRAHGKSAEFWDLADEPSESATSP